MTVMESEGKTYFVPHEKYVRKRAEEAVGELNGTCEPTKRRHTLRAVRNEVWMDKKDGGNARPARHQLGSPRRAATS